MVSLISIFKTKRKKKSIPTEFDLILEGYNFMSLF